LGFFTEVVELVDLPANAEAIAGQAGTQFQGRVSQDMTMPGE